MPAALPRLLPHAAISSAMREQVEIAQDAALVKQGNVEPILRARLYIERVEPLDWLRTAPDPLRFYGATRDRAQLLEVGAAGVMDLAEWPHPVAYTEVFERLRSVLDVSGDGLRYYGGLRFAMQDTPDPDWQAFGAARFVVPRFELRTAPQASMLSLHFRSSELNSGAVERALAELDAMSFAAGEWKDTFPPPRARRDAPDYADWQTHVEQALAAFSEGALEKIVLARKAQFDFDAPLDPITLLHRLRAATPDCYHFCFMPTPDAAFVGASPERLYHRDGQALATEAVAGTRPRPADPGRSAKYGDDLLNSEKDQREHAYVRDGIREALEPLCEALEIDAEPSLLELARGQHLYTGVKAKLKAQVDDAQILAALHPTPALGGWPTGEALRRIAEMEPFDRGWYAAPVGWVSRDAAEFAVGIRSGLIQPNRLSLFSGAGIVAGSTPDTEWDEIEHKISDFIRVLTGT